MMDPPTFILDCMNLGRKVSLGLMVMSYTEAYESSAWW